MIGALGGIAHWLEGHLGSKTVVESAGHGIAPGAPGFLTGHRSSSVCTTFKAYSAYTGSEAMA